MAHGVFIVPAWGGWGTCADATGAGRARLPMRIATSTEGMTAMRRELTQRCQTSHGAEVENKSGKPN